MVSISTPYTLKHAQADYRAKEAQLRRQTKVGAPGLGKGSATNELVELGLITSKAEGVYEFSTRLKELARRCPEYADNILPQIDAGMLVDPKYVKLAYEQDLTDFGFGINSKIADGKTVIYDGLPRQAGLPKELNQVEMLRSVHGDRVFDLATIMRHSDNYVPVVRQLMREFQNTHYSGENGRADTFKAVKRVVSFNEKLDDLAAELNTISSRMIQYHADNVTPAQSAFLYLTMAANDVEEEEVRSLAGFKELGIGEHTQPSITEKLHSAKMASQVHGGDKNAETSVGLLETQIEKVLQAQHQKMPFDDFVQMWKDLGYYDMKPE